MRQEVDIVQNLLNSEPRNEYLVHYRQKLFEVLLR